MKRILIKRLFYFFDAAEKAFDYLNWDFLFVLMGKLILDFALGMR